MMWRIVIITDLMVGGVQLSVTGRNISLSYKGGHG